MIRWKMTVPVVLFFVALLPIARPRKLELIGALLVLFTRLLNAGTIFPMKVD
jgi:hypothetical protein